MPPIRERLYSEYADKIILLARADLELRQSLLRQGLLNDSYHPDMEALHKQNTLSLQAIISKIGYPTAELLGTEAADAAWLIIQHSISHPAFMRSCLALLTEVIDTGKGNALHHAYLSDRIAVFEDRPQLFGTQYDWDETGRLSPKCMDDLTKVNQRRTSIGLPSVEENTELIRQRAVQENESPPRDQEKKQESYEHWRKKVGWIKSNTDLLNDNVSSKQED